MRGAFSADVMETSPGATAPSLPVRRRRSLSDLAFQGNRKLYPRLFSALLPYYIVNEFPKSGGTWLATMLSDALCLPFPRHRRLRLQPAIVHGHFLHRLGLRNVLVLWRDPRDIFVSYYHHCYFVNEHANRGLVGLMKSRLPFRDYADIRANLPDFIRFLNERPVSPRYTWSRFAEKWVDQPGVSCTHYEGLRHDGPNELRRVVRELTGEDLPPDQAEAICDRRSFARAKAAAEARAGNRAGVQLSFVREGSTGGWRQHFNEESSSLVDHYCGPMMARLGYL